MFKISCSKLFLEQLKIVKSVYHHHYRFHHHRRVTVLYHPVHPTPDFTPKFSSDFAAQSQNFWVEYGSVCQKLTGQTPQFLSAFSLIDPEIMAQNESVFVFLTSLSKAYLFWNIPLLKNLKTLSLNQAFYMHLSNWVKNKVAQIVLYLVVFWRKYYGFSNIRN